jgi:uncharacterized membrane protein
MNRPLTIARPAASEGIGWLKEAWAWFMPSAIAWTGMTALVMLVLMMLALIPYAGTKLIEILSPFMVAGYMAASRGAERGEPVTFLFLGAGFAPEHRIKLAIVGGFYLICMLSIEQLMRQLGGEGFQQIALLSANPEALPPEEIKRTLDQIMPAVLIGMLLLTPIFMATWFAPALVLFNGFSASNALWWSLWACAVNWRPILLYSLLLVLIGVVALIIPFGLGLLVFLPIVLGSTYAAYRTIFVPATTE